MELSRHAEVRSQQRSIPRDYIEMIMEFGTPTRKPGNALEYKIHKRDRQQAISRLKRLINTIDKCQKKAVLVDRNLNQVITVYNKI